MLNYSRETKSQLNIAMLEDAFLQVGCAYMQGMTIECKFLFTIAVWSNISALHSVLYGAQQLFAISQGEAQIQSAFQIVHFGEYILVFVLTCHH